MGQIRDFGIHTYCGFSIKRIEKTLLQRLIFRILKQTLWRVGNRIIMFGLACFFSFGMPLIIFEDKIQAYFYGGCLARVLVWHTTWFVNSLAHWLGDDEYSNETSAKDHFITALLTLGEGNHGFHHAFPTSYKNGVKWYQYDPTKWLIELGSLFGLCYELYHPTENEIQKARFQVSEKKTTNIGQVYYLAFLAW